MFHKHEYTNGFPVSGYGYTEYYIKFCKDCGKLFWKLTKDIDNLYPDLMAKDTQ